MQKLNGSKWSFATVMGAVAVLVLCGTTGAVAGGLVTSAKIKNNTIQSVDVKNNALTGTDIKNSSLGSADIADYSLSNQDINVLFASVNPDGTLDSSSGGATSTRGGTGSYSVRFAGRDIHKCAWNATPTTPSGIIPSHGQVTTADLLGQPDGVFVATSDSGGTSADLGFHLIVVC
ncbi:MAG: hypothetical protein ACJ72D_28175 [Marmoricola sp.]